MRHNNLIFKLAGAVLVGGCASAPPIEVPAALQPAVNTSLAMTVAARGVQIYECRPGKSGAGNEWAFVAPEAELFDEFGRSVGSHGAGPFWQASDGSRVIGTLKARTDAPTPGAIPWLLLDTKSTGREGSFARVSSIQRVNTVGGVAPKTPCAPGESTRVPYTADYRLFAVR